MANAQTAQMTGKDNRPRRRMIPIVDARFQWKYTLAIMAFGVGLTAVMGWFLYRAYASTTRAIELTEYPEVREELMRGDQLILLWLIILIVVMGVGLGFWGLITTHRICGPLYIVARYLNVLAGGRYPDMRPLRKHDELQEFFSVFEDAINTLRNRDRAALRELEVAIADAKTGASGDARASLDAALDFLERRRDAIAAAVGAGDGVDIDDD
jgi:hypothetical protein